MTPFPAQVSGAFGGKVRGEMTVFTDLPDDGCAGCDQMAPLVVVPA